MRREIEIRLDCHAHPLTHSSWTPSRRELRIKWCPVMHNVPSTGPFDDDDVVCNITPSNFGVEISSANSILCNRSSAQRLSRVPNRPQTRPKRWPSLSLRTDSRNQFTRLIRTIQSNRMIFIGRQFCVRSLVRLVDSRESQMNLIGLFCGAIDFALGHVSTVNISGHFFSVCVACRFASLANWKSMNWGKI